MLATTINMIRSWPSSSAGAGSLAPAAAHTALPIQMPEWNIKHTIQRVSSAKTEDTQISISTFTFGRPERVFV
jgi:hypothetical protein